MRLGPVSASACCYQLARTSVPFPARRDCPIYWPQDAGQVSAGQVSAGQVGAGKVRASPIRAGKPGGEQIRPGQVRAGEHRAGEVRAGQIRASQVNRPQVALGKPAPERGDGCLPVGPRRSLPGAGRRARVAASADVSAPG